MAEKLSPDAKAVADAQQKADAVAAEAAETIAKANAEIAAAQAKVDAVKAEIEARIRAADAKLRAERVAKFAESVRAYLVANDTEFPYQVPNSLFDEMRRAVGL